MSNNHETTLEIVEEMYNWIIKITSINKQQEEAYQIVCDDYQSFIQRLTESKTNTKLENEKKAADFIINCLDHGFNTCPNWITTSQCMEHFVQLRKTIKNSKSILQSISLMEKCENERNIIKSLLNDSYLEHTQINEEFKDENENEMEFVKNNGGYVKTGDGNKMEFVKGQGGYVKTGDEDKMEWIKGEGGYVKTGDGDKMEWIKGEGGYVKTGDGDKMEWKPTNKI
jgi:hypothetical protein